VLATLSVDSTTIRLSARPEPVWIEEGLTSRSLNFDLIVVNPTPPPTPPSCSTAALQS
jgi:hypothetical protein